MKIDTPEVQRISSSIENWSVRTGRKKISRFRSPAFSLLPASEGNFLRPALLAAESTGLRSVDLSMLTSAKKGGYPRRVPGTEHRLKRDPHITL